MNFFSFYACHNSSPSSFFLDFIIQIIFIYNIHSPVPKPVSLSWENFKANDKGKDVAVHHHQPHHYHHVHEGLGVFPVP